MCYTLEQSKISFIVNIITSYLLYVCTTDSDYKIIALFFLFVGFMQFFDIIFWMNQDMTDPRQAEINYITTKIAMFINHLQPFVFGYLIYTYKGSIGIFSKIILIMYFLSMSIYTINAYDNIKYTLKTEGHRDCETKDDSTGSVLRWDWIKQKHNTIVYAIYVMSFTILAYDNFSYPLNIISACMNIFIYFSSMVYFKEHIAGRLWCKISAWLPLIFILIHEKQRKR